MKARNNDSTPKKWLDITVSEDQEDRALRIFSTVWNAAEAKGYHLQYTHLEEKIEQIIEVLENIADERDRAEGRGT